MVTRADTAWAAAAGVLAVAVALGAGELAAGALKETSLVVGVGQFIIDNAPGGASSFAIEVFGHHDKTALVVAVIAGCLGLGAVAGTLAVRLPWAGAALIAAFALTGGLAAGDDPTISAVNAAVAAITAGLAGIVALQLLGEPVSRATAAGRGEKQARDVAQGRRQFFRIGGGAVAFALGSTATGRWAFGPAVNIEGERAAVELPSPPPAQGLATPPTSGGLELDGISPLITPNADFYRIDTALRIPGVEVDGWRLKVTGLVDEPYELTYDELVGMGVREEIVTLACVSNQVGGDLVGNARWLGVPLATLIDRAGIRPEGTQIVARSIDGFTTAFPTAVALDGRPSMVAVGMNGEALPAAHGFPARMIVPGLYGYVSATKWLEEIEVTTDDFDAYWITRGWAKEGPIKTQSRIDVPDGNATIDAGPIQVGGVAWAGIRGVGAVEIRLVDAVEANELFGDSWIRDMPADYGVWHTAVLSDELADHAWRQWAADLDASTPGEYRIEVRAIDGDGAIQTNLRRQPAPDGATGYDGFDLKVE